MKVGVVGIQSGASRRGVVQGSSCTGRAGNCFLITGVSGLDGWPSSWQRTGAAWQMSGIAGDVAIGECERRA